MCAKYGFWIRLALTSAAVAFLLTTVDLRNVVEVIAHAHIALLGLAFANNLFGRFLTAWQMTRMMRLHGARYSVWKMLSITLRTLFYGFFLPGELAFAGIRWYLISRIDGLRAQTFASMTYVRLAQITLLLGTGLVAVMMDWPFSSLTFLPICWILFFVLVSITFLLHTRLPSVSRPWIIKSPLYERLPQWGKRRLDNLLSAFCSFSGLSLGDTVGIWGAGLMFKLSVAASFWLISRSLGIDVGFLTLLWLSSIVELIQLLPISIAGLGPREASMMYILGFYGVTASASVSFSLVIFVLRILVSLLGGFLVLWDVISGKSHTPRSAT